MAPIDMDAPKSNAQRAEQLAVILTTALALFGDQLTRQFLAAIRSWQDYLLLASSPLGVIPVTINIIRIAGPEWLKLLIGR